MLHVANHPLHSDIDVDRRIRGLLDSSDDICMPMLKLINDTGGDRPRKQALRCPHREQGELSGREHWAMLHYEL